MPVWAHKERNKPHASVTYDWPVQAFIKPLVTLIPVHCPGHPIRQYCASFIVKAPMDSTWEHFATHLDLHTRTLWAVKGEASAWLTCKILWKLRLRGKWLYFCAVPNTALLQTLHLGIFVNVLIAHSDSALWFYTSSLALIHGWRTSAL